MDFLSFALSAMATVFVLLAILIVVMSAWIVVPEKSYVTTTLFGGRYYKTYESGLHFKLPWPIESKDRTVSLQIQELGISASSLTRDGAQMTLAVQVQYRPKENKYYEAAYVLSRPAEQIESYILNSLRGEINGNTVDGILEAKKQISDRIEKELEKEFDSFGYHLEGLLMGEPHLSAEMRSAWERKLIANRNLDAAQAEGELDKVKRVARADAEGEALKKKTQALVDSRAIMAQGNVAALNEFVSGIHDGSLTSRDALAFFNALDTREALRDAAVNGGKTVFISGGSDVQMNNLVGAMHSDHAGRPAPVQAPKPVQTAKPAAPAKSTDPFAGEPSDIQDFGMA